MSNEVVECKNQEVCKFAAAHTNSHSDTKNKYDSLYYQMMRHMLVQAYCFPETMWDTPSEAPNSRKHCKCGRCKEKGHYKSNKRECLEHPDYKGPEVVSSDDELSGEEEAYANNSDSDSDSESDSE